MRIVRRFGIQFAFLSLLLSCSAPSVTRVEDAKKVEPAAKADPKVKTTYTVENDIPEETRKKLCREWEAGLKHTEGRLETEFPGISPGNSKVVARRNKLNLTYLNFMSTKNSIAKEKLENIILEGKDRGWWKRPAP